MNKQRSSGILMAVSSLPGPYGIGSLGKPAFDFIDFLARGGQTYWQLLPLVPPGDGASPYMSQSAFAGNPCFIDLDLLVQEGLLTRQEADQALYHAPDRVDYRWLAQTRIPLLRRAWERSKQLPIPPTCPGWKITPLFLPCTSSLTPPAPIGPPMPFRTGMKWISTVFCSAPSTASGLP